MGFCTWFALGILLLMTIAQVYSEQWNFGVPNAPGSIVIANIGGKFGLFERKKNIYLAVPQCALITFVRVLVDNLISTPKVHFDPHTNVVTISYKLWQHGLSTYDILAEAVFKQGCIVNPAINPALQQPWMPMG